MARGPTPVTLLTARPDLLSRGGARPVGLRSKDTVAVRRMTFRQLQVEGLTHSCRVQFLATSIRGRALAPVEQRRHSVALSAPLGADQTAREMRVEVQPAEPEPMHLLPSRVSVQQLHRASAAADVALRSFDPMPLEPAVSVEAEIEGPSATLMAAVLDAEGRWLGCSGFTVGPLARGASRDYELSLGGVGRLRFVATAQDVRGER